jgi:hypothetical protein
MSELTKNEGLGFLKSTQILAVMTMDGSMDAAAFEVFVRECLVPRLWPGAVVTIDNLPAHKAEVIVPLIEAVGARVLFLSPYSPEFNPIEHWWSTTPEILDILIRTALDLIVPEHLRNWFAHYCYCISDFCASPT